MARNRNMRDRTPALNFDDARLQADEGDNSISLREAMHDADLLDFDTLYETDVPSWNGGPAPVGPAWGTSSDAGGLEQVSYDQQGEELG